MDPKQQRRGSRACKGRGRVVRVVGLDRGTSNYMNAVLVSGSGESREAKCAIEKC